MLNIVTLCVNFILNLICMLNRVTLRVNFILNLIRMLNRVTLRVNFLLNLIRMLNKVTLCINFILNMIRMLNIVALCVNYFKFDWHAKFGMSMLNILFPFNLVFLEISTNSLVGDELPPDDSFLSRPFRVPAEEPPTKYSVK